MSVHIKADLEAFAWIEKIVNRYEEIEATYPSLPIEKIDTDFKENQLGFNLAFPCPPAKEKKNEAIKARIFLKASGDPFILSHLNKLLGLEKEVKKLGAELTRHGFKDPDRKAWKKFFSEGVAS